MPLIPKLEDRTLYIDLDSTNIYYEYKICVKKFLFACVKKEWKRDTYDYTDKSVRKMLIDVGFKLKSDRRRE